MFDRSSDGTSADDTVAANGTPSFDAEKTSPTVPPASNTGAGAGMNPWHPGAFPDGGAEAWLTVLGSFCAMFVSFGWIGAIGAFQEHYQLNQLKDYSPSQVSWIPSVQACFMFLGGSWVGRFQDYYGPTWLIPVGTLLHVFGLMMASLSTKYYQFILSQSICSSIGASLLFYPASSCLATWFMKKRAVAFSIAACGSSLGGVIFPIMVRNLIEDFGFGWAMRTCAFVVLALSTVAGLTIKCRIPPTKAPFKAMDFVRSITELPFLLLSLSMFLIFTGLFVPFIFMSIEAVNNGMSHNISVYLVSVFNGVSILGRTLPAPIADKYGRFNVVIVMSWLTAIFTLAIWIPANSNAARWLYSAFFGFSSGAIVSMGPAMVAQISDVRQIGIRTGTMYTFVAVAVLIGNPIAGSLVTDNGTNYGRLKIFGGSLMCGGSLVLMGARWSLSNGKLIAKV